MNKRNRSSLDPKDHQILILLVEDGRMTSREIARRIPGLSERAVRYRIQRMLKRGLIQVRAIADARQLGFPVTADVWMKVDPGLITQVAEELSRMARVTYVAHSFGDQDVIIQIVARDVDDLHRYLTEVVARVPGVTGTTTYIVKKLKDIHTWFLVEDPPVMQAGSISPGEE